jgi:hypothetical protein
MQAILLAALSSLLKPESLAVWLPLLASGLGFLLKSIMKDKYDARVELFEKATQVAYNIVNDIAKRTPSDVDDKVALGLKALHDYFATHGATPTPAEVTKAQLVFQAMNGEGK